MKTCFFIGHSYVKDDIHDLLRDAIERHITEYGVTSFTVGHYGEFDRLVTEALIEAKRQHPEIVAYVLIPYHPYDQPYKTPKGFDGTYYPFEGAKVPKRVAIPRANEYMIRNSDFLICYDRGVIGKTRDFVALARGREKRGQIHVENLAEEIPK